MARPRVLTQRALNRALLARQHLLAPAATGTPLPRVLERVGGLQAQYAPSMYVALWWRLEGFEPAELTAALERRTVVQATLIRITIHLVSRADFWPMALALREAWRTLWLRAEPGAPPVAEMEAAAEAVRAGLADGPVRRAEVEALVGKLRARGVGLWLDLVRAPPSGMWERRRADLFALAEDWLGPPGDATPEAGLELLVRRYLGGFGPATRTEIADWAGVGVRALAPALERLRLRTCHDEAGEELLDLPRAPLPDPDTPAPVRFLPTWDASLLVHARRSGVLPEPYRPRIFSSRNPHSVPTFLVDGAVAGTWRFEGGTVPLEPFERLDQATRRALREEADRLTAFHS